MDKALAPARDLTDDAQNQAVLDAATALIGGSTPPGRCKPARAPGVPAEAQPAPRSRQRLAGAGEPVHLTVTWAMYGETGRMVPRAVHPHGEDFVRAKVRQLDWLAR